MVEIRAYTHFCNYSDVVFTSPALSEIVNPFADARAVFALLINVEENKEEEIIVVLKRGGGFISLARK